MRHLKWWTWGSGTKERWWHRCREIYCGDDLWYRRWRDLWLASLWYHRGGVVVRDGGREEVKDRNTEVGKIEIVEQNKDGG